MLHLNAPFLPAAGIVYRVGREASQLQPEMCLVKGRYKSWYTAAPTHKHPALNVEDCFCHNAMKCRTNWNNIYVKSKLWHLLQENHHQLGVKHCTEEY
ncbi:hypothetical protein scyTo_0015918 [Scyliorhinus torazame]|uniref:Uncharacterized protein n=1 Tax=Scyliorhinus torazame TaxID=75743 RepID=A0A401Q0U1_SCYTO|nr:hypothetical protein [Scyliorhinus torazame]